MFLSFFPSDIRRMTIKWVLRRWNMRCMILFPPLIVIHRVQSVQAKDKGVSYCADYPGKQRKQMCWKYVYMSFKMELLRLTFFFFLPKVFWWAAPHKHFFSRQLWRTRCRWVSNPRTCKGGYVNKSKYSYAFYRFFFKLMQIFVIRTWNGWKNAKFGSPGVNSYCGRKVHTCFQPPSHFHYLKEFFNIQVCN